MNWQIFNYRITKISNSIKDIISEFREIDDKPLKGFAFTHPLLSYSYDLRAGRKVITDMGIGRIDSFIKGEFTVAVMLEKKKFIIHRHPKELSILVILGEDNKFKPLSEHDWKHVINKTRNNVRSFPVEYRKTRHGNYALTSDQIEYFKNLQCS